MRKAILPICLLGLLAAAVYSYFDLRKTWAAFPEENRQQSSFATNEERLAFLRSLGLKLEASCEPIVEDLAYQADPVYALEFVLIDETGRCPSGNEIMITTTEDEIYWFTCGWLGVSETQGFYFCNREAL